jgi:thiamine biosynthesis lipoprotein
MHDLTFTCMGCRMRLLAEGVDAGEVEAARRLLEALDARLSRFRPDSELSRLNADPRTTVPASPPLRGAVGAALWAAERTDGLVDPTLLAPLERQGYSVSLGGLDAVPAATALAAAPPRAFARPAQDAAWRAVRVDGEAGTITRPLGVRLDTGGTTKGFAADLVAWMLTGARRLVVDCGGDLRVAVAPGAPAFDVGVEHPLTGQIAAELWVGDGAVATSGISRRLWLRAHGRPAHHLLDPATGEPAWTGLLTATALAETAVEAEALAKAAYLSGPAGGRRLLRRHGGVLVLEDGSVERIGAAARQRPRVSLGELGVAA